ncbi:MAG: DUF928 domain-containing protein [Elainella sp. Prado103]|nr:DUF928 domain-containing protein [Elainella sp. Prado103]
MKRRSLSDILMLHSWGLWVQRMLLLSCALTLFGIGILPSSLAQEFNPEDRGLPGRRQGGGTRGGCLTQQPTLTALIPDTNLGTTLSEYPSFFWYVPENNAVAAEFVLLDANNQELYQTILPVTQQAGIVQFKLPEDGTAQPLKTGESYRWYFSLICNPLDRSTDSFTTGWIRRIEPSAELTAALSRATAAEKPQIYLQQGIWYEGLTSLVQLHQTQPQTPGWNQQWQQLLRSIGLDQIADQLADRPFMIQFFSQDSSSRHLSSRHLSSRHLIVLLE